jgi:hypothetical protein
MKITPQEFRVTLEIHARLVDIALNDPDREKRIAAASAEREFWNGCVVPIFGDPEIQPGPCGTKGSAGLLPTASHFAEQPRADFGPRRAAPRTQRPEPDDRRIIRPAARLFAGS